MSDCLFPYWLIYKGFQALQLIVLAMFVTLDQPVVSFITFLSEYVHMSQQLLIINYILFASFSRLK